MVAVELSKAILNAEPSIVYTLLPAAPIESISEMLCWFLTTATVIVSYLFTLRF